jgi:hypothetical protein
VAVLEAANANLKAALDQEVAARQAADTTLQNAINSEAAARLAADNAESAARQAADTTLQNAINAESANRQAADSALQSAITNQTTNLTNAIAAAKPKVLFASASNISVGNFDKTILVVHPNEPGQYVVNAKVSLYNRDGDYQSGGCKLWVDAGSSPPVEIDATSVRVGAKDDADQVSIALQGGYYNAYFPVRDIYLTCGTYNGTVYSAVLTAIQLP